MIVAFIAIIQILLVTYGGKALACHPEGLNSAQWLICIICAAGGWVMNFVLKFLPDPNFSVILI